ncbi:Serine/threonine-protein kinase STY46 [Galdieria sulphuraria]|nr:Serine/threonine-protein kinase STY46 [Galdieria sulphuraria]
MELLRGASLEKMRNTLKGDYAKVAEIFYRCVEVVEYLHSRNIIHRDLKPSNFFVLEGGCNIKVLDFGVAKSFRANATLTGDTGSYWYMAPEVISDGYVENEKQYDMKADIYSMGIILNELLTGVTPYIEYPDATPWQIANTVLRQGLRPQLVADCPCLTEFQSLIQACWVEDPRNRPNISQVRIEMFEILKRMGISVKDYNKTSCNLQ